VPDEGDIEVVRAFVRETVRTYGIVVEDRRTGRAVERELLKSALLEFSEKGHPERIVSQYASAGNDGLRDAGLYGQQLRSKRELARFASDDLVGPEVVPTPRLGRFSRPRIRRWIKRCKVVLGSLKGIVPGAESLNELLDLLDAALDRN
jgi:hypothetical protein